MRVVPRDEVGELAPEVCLALRHQPSACALVFHRSDEALDHGNAPVLPYRSESWPNALAAAPALETLTPEDAALVADQGLGPHTAPSDQPPQETAYRQ
jgi:hypothetical protein